VPIITSGVTIVVDPIALKDQYDKLIDNGITNASYINSFNNKKSEMLECTGLIDSDYLILFVSPERSNGKFQTVLI
jgi:superfamily II DNA helicase RecQ